MKKESKYLIVKWDDIFKYLTQGQLDMLDLMDGQNNDNRL